MSERQKGGGRRKPGEESLSLPLSSAAALSSTPIHQARHRSLSPTVAPAKRARMREEETPTTRKKKDVEGNIASKKLFPCDEKEDQWTKELNEEMAKVNEASRIFDEEEEEEPESSEAKQSPFPRDIALTPSQLRASSLGVNTGDVLPNPNWSLTIMDWRPVIGSNDRQQSFEQPRQAPIFDFHDETGHGRRQQEGSGDNTDTEFQYIERRPTKLNRHTNESLAEDRCSGPLPFYLDYRLKSFRTRDEPRHAHVNPLRTVTNLDYTTTRCILLSCKQRRKNCQEVTDVTTPWQLYYYKLKLYIHDSRCAFPPQITDCPQVEAFFLAVPKSGTELDQSRLLVLTGHDDSRVISYQMVNYHGFHQNKSMPCNFGRPVDVSAEALHAELNKCLQHRTTRRPRTHILHPPNEPKSAKRMQATIKDNRLSPSYAFNHYAERAADEAPSHNPLAFALSSDSEEPDDEVEELPREGEANRRLYTERLEIQPHYRLSKPEARRRAEEALILIATWKNQAAKAVMGIDYDQLRHVKIENIRVTSLLRPVWPEHVQQIKRAMLEGRVKKLDYRAILLEEKDINTNKLIYYALDGQHRVVAAVNAIRENPNLRSAYGSIPSLSVRASKYAQYLLYGRPHGERAHRHFTWFEKIVAVRKARDSDPSILDPQFLQPQKIRICADLLYEKRVSAEFVRVVDMSDVIFERFHDWALRYFIDQLKVTPARVQEFISAVYRNPRKAFKILAPAEDADANVQAEKLRNLKKDVASLFRNKNVTLEGGLKKWSAARLNLTPEPTYGECIKAATMPTPNFMGRETWNDYYLDLLGQRINEMRNESRMAPDPMQYSILKPQEWSVSADSTALLIDTKALAHDALERTLEHIASLSASDGCEATRFAFCIGSTAPLKDVLPAGLTLKRHSLFATFVRDEDAVCDGRPEKKGTIHDNGWPIHLIGYRLGALLSCRQLLAQLATRNLMWMNYLRLSNLRKLLSSFTRADNLQVVVGDELMTLHLYHVLLSSGIGGHFFTSDEDFVDKRRCSEAVEEPPASDSSDDESDTETRMAAETLTVYGVVRRVRATRNSTEEEEEEREEEANEQEADE